MTRKRSNKAKTGRSRQGGMAPGPSAQALQYLGPIRSPVTKNQVSTAIVVASCTFDISSNGSGVVNNVFSSGNVNSINVWSSWAATWDEYRVLGFEVKYEPYNRYNSGTVNVAPIFSVVDQNDSGSLANAATAAEYESCMLHGGSDPWKRVARMSGVSDSQFTPTSSVASHYWIKIYSTGNTISTKIGTVLVTFRIQFRGAGE